MATVTVHRFITLKLSEKEANFIKDLCQNPLMENEPESTAELRKAIFLALCYPNEARHD